MIKIPQIKDLPDGFHYITAITKAQIDTLIDKKVIQHRNVPADTGRKLPERRITN